MGVRVSAGMDFNTELRSCGLQQEVPECLENQCTMFVLFASETAIRVLVGDLVLC